MRSGEGEALGTSRKDAARVDGSDGKADQERSRVKGVLAMVTKMV